MITFDLQLFADGETGTPAVTTTTAPAASATTTSTESTERSAPKSNTPQDSAPPEAKKPTIALYTDPQTGRKRICTITDNESNAGENTETHSETEEETARLPPQEESHVPTEKSNSEPEGLITTEPYTLEQLNQAISAGSVNENRIPQQYARQYVAYMAQQQAAMQQQQQQEREQQAATQQQALQQRNAMLQKISDDTRIQTLNELGITEEDLASAEYSDDDDVKAKTSQFRQALLWNYNQNVMAVQRQLAQQSAISTQQQNIYRDITSYVQDQQAKEPNFSEIDKMLATHYQTLPYKDAAGIADAINAYKTGSITSQQCQTLQKYYENTRVAWYAQHESLSTKPKKVPIPAVEKPGGGAPAPAKPFDFSSLRTMSETERRAALSNYWRRK
jgi:hypothetical protein